MCQEDLFYELSRHLDEKYGARIMARWYVGYDTEAKVLTKLPDMPIVLVFYWDEFERTYEAHGITYMLTALDNTIAKAREMWNNM